MSSIRLKDVLPRGNSFCVLPFIHKHINLNNKQKVCCISSTVVDEDRINSVRADMLANKPIPECIKCQTQEQQGQFSERQLITKQWMKKYPDLDFDNPPELSYDLRFSNLCNLRCQTCNPGSSSEWARFIGQETVYKTVDPEISISSDAERIYLAGGEPFMVKSFSAMLDSLENTNCEIIINTNATILTDHMMSALRRFNDVCFVLSIDGTGETIERIRTLCSWDIIQDNIRTLKQELDPQFMVNTVVQHDNIDNIPELAEWIDQQNIDVWHAHICTHPEQFHYSHYKGNISWSEDLWKRHCVTKNVQVQNALRTVYSNLSA